MKRTNQNIGWTPNSDDLKNEITSVDNEIEQSIGDLGLFSRAHAFGLRKAKGVSLKQILVSILIWPLLSVSSLSFFCGNRLSAYFKDSADVLHDFLKRQNINWLGYRCHIAKRFFEMHRLKDEPVRIAEQPCIRVGHRIDQAENH